MLTSKQINYIQALPPDTCREVIKSAYEGTIQELASIITTSQYEYAIRTLPPIKANALQKAYLDRIQITGTQVILSSGLLMPPK